MSRKSKNNDRTVVFEDVEFKNIPTPGRMPLPPEHLVKQAAVQSAEQAMMAQSEIFEIVGDVKPQAGSSEALREALSAKNDEGFPNKVDYLLYSRAVEDRRTAETQYAEIYSQYLQAVTFNETLVRRISTFKRFLRRNREVYNRAKNMDMVVAENLKLVQRDLAVSDKAMNDIQLENQALRTSLSAHEQAFEQITKKLGMAELELERAHKQFESLANEFETQNLFLIEADRKLKANGALVEQLETNEKDLQKKYSAVRDENLLLQNQLRESQINEAGSGALNSELASSITRLQKQIAMLEEKLLVEKNKAKAKDVELQQQIERLTDKRHADVLVEQAKQLNSNFAQNKPIVPRAVNREQFDTFFNRWSQIIGELSSHSAPMKANDAKDEAIKEQLMSERGDLDLV